MKPTKFYLDESDLASLDRIAARLGLRGARAPGARSAVVRYLIREADPIAEAVTEGCPPEVPQTCPRICWHCDQTYVGTIRCPYPGCDGVGEPLESTGA